MKEGNEGDFYLGEAFMWWGILKMSQYLLFAFKLIKMMSVNILNMARSKCLVAYMLWIFIHFSTYLLL